MLVNTLHAMPVEKELISNFAFPSDVVITDPVARRERQQKLRRATFLGNIEHLKIRIFFQDVDGPKVVHTTIWATGTENIVLKYGITIPINRIYDVKVL